MHGFVRGALVALASVCGAGAFADDAVSTYASIRREVIVKKAAQDPRRRTRPAKFFQLAGAANEKLCAEVLEIFNEPGRFEGHDPRWLLESSRQIDFRSMNVPQASEDGSDTQYNFPDLEHVSVDIDSDGRAEHAYRLNSTTGGPWHQRLMIVGVELQSRPEMLGSYAKQCAEIESPAECGWISTKIRYALRARVPDRLAEEWEFTKQSPWTWTTSDPASQSLIFPEPNRAARNIASDSDAYWSLYRIGVGVVAVAAPIQSFAPPELAVFVPAQQRGGGLQCLLMPVAWHK